MENIVIQGSSGTSRVIFDESCSGFMKYVPSDKKVIAVTDPVIIRLYPGLFENIPVITIEQGEHNKSLQTLEKIFTGFLNCNVDRSWFVVGIGGGIVTDVTGFAASIYMRGLPFGFVSTTLLSQVDASVGGKNGVNFGDYKNILGVFAQPSFVICDPAVLSTLPSRDFISGFAEIIKAAAIRDMNLLKFLEDNSGAALANDPAVMRRLIYESVRIKAEVVKNDEKEQGERRILNFGHTFAHSIELFLGLTHGEAVSAGMALAADTSVKMGLLQTHEADRLKSLLEKYKLPVRLKFDKDLIYNTLLKDKKREGDFIHLVLLNGLGKAVVQKVPLSKMEEIVDDLC